MKKKRRRGISIPIKLPFNLYPALLVIIAFGAGYSLNGIEKNTFVDFPENSAKVCFSPGGNCESQIIELINKANNEIYMQAYSFTSKPIAAALLNAHKRGVRVEILYDRSSANGSNSQIVNLKSAGINTKEENTNGLYHNKIILIDGLYTLTGSYNFTYSANVKNSENFMVIKSAGIYDIYKKRYIRLRDNF